MHKRELQSARAANPTVDALSLADLEYQARSWQIDGDVRQLSKGTIANRRLVTGKLLWFLRQHEFERCGTLEIRSYLAYLRDAHESESGRWGNSARKKPLRPVSAKFHYDYLQAFFNYVVEEGALERSPMATLKPPVVRDDQIQPFSKEQSEALRAAARKSKNARRDEAIVLFLLDTGARASEVCNLRVRDVDLTGQSCDILGKGNKRRMVYLGGTTRKALWQYLKEEPRDPDDSLFISNRGRRAGDPLTRSGLLQLIQRIGKEAGIKARRCSPHTFRHTFAVEYLRAGGDVFSLQQLLGHTDLEMTQRYVAYAQADIQTKHRQFSPADRLARRGK